MQTNQPDITQLLTDWFQLTQENSLYAGFLLLCGFILAVIFYSIRIYFLKKQHGVTEQAGIKLQSQLDETLQLNTLSEEKFNVVVDQLTEEQQINSAFVAKVEGRNQTIIENIKELASKFNLSEELVAPGGKPKTEFVWKQQDNIQLQLTQRLQAVDDEKNTLQQIYDQEKVQFSKQNSQIKQLQKTLDLQTSKATQLEQDLSVQKQQQQQLKSEAEQILADKLSALQAKHDLEKATNNYDEEAPIIPIEKSDVVINESRLVEPEPADIEEISAPEEETSISPESEGEQEELEPDYTESSLDITGKFKSLFSKSKKQMDEPGIQEHSETLASGETIPEAGEEIQDTKSNLDIAGKFKGLFAKKKKQAEEIAVEEIIPAVAEELIDDKPEIDPVIPEPSVEADSVEEAKESESDEQVYVPDYEKSNFSLPGKLKKLFGKSEI